ncbi:hypothetical protein RP20_CCG017951 [Aedes albopictus]|nr:coagulation factor XI-like [Aedes albopictus]KXJ81805.1 hypothetical protein RP20_CCG017951 [Aedes albopictus]
MKDVVLVFALVLAVVSCSKYEALVVRRDPPTYCGIRKITKQALIVKGTETVPGEWPWHVAVYHVSDGGRTRKYTCGGTLIQRNIVLTTASCARYGVDKPEGAILVELGQHNLQESFAQARQIPVSQAVVHESYEEGENKFDIGILKLKTLANYSDYIQPACMPTSVQKIETFEDSLGTIVGWGFYEAGKLSDTLQSAQVPVIPILTCLQSNRDFFSRNINHGMYCAGLQNGTAPCFGDAGGGMFFRSGQSWFLRGIISFTSRVYTETAGCNTSDYFGLVNVEHFLPWIKQTIASLGSGRRRTSK